MEQLPFRFAPGLNDRKLADWADSLDRADRIAAHTREGGLLSDLSRFTDYDPWRRSARALAEGFSKAVFVLDNGYWDTHGQNRQQTRLHSDLFEGLGQLLAELEAAGIRDDTVVLVLSEMGRSPLLNDIAGKDHWPYTSAMMIGPDVSPTVVRGTDDGLVQRTVSRSTGEPDPQGRALQSADVLATAATMLGLDGGALYPQAEVIDAVVA